MGCTETGIGNAERARPVVPHGKQHGHVLRVQLALLQLLVQRGQHVRGSEVLRGQRPQNAADQCRIQRGRGQPCR